MIASPVWGARMVNKEEITYKGIVFRRYPDSPRRTERVYFTCNSRYFKMGIRRLHQEIWKDAHGEIPEHYHVHHKDGNPLNNTIENLECVPRGEHISHHVKEWAVDHKPQMSARAKANVHKLLEWYETEEGKAQRRNNVKYLHTVKHPYKCIVCGKEGESFLKSSKFCSNACSAKWRRDSGIDNEERKCSFCGKAFIINKYSKIICCSRKCGGSMRTLKH